MIRFLPGRLLILPFIFMVNSLLAIDFLPNLADTAKTTTRQPFQIDEINQEIEKAQKKFIRMNYLLGPDGSVKKIDSDFRIYQITLQKEYQEMKEYKTSHFSKFVLDNSYFIWKDFELRLLNWQEKINSKIRKNRIYIDELDEMNQQWQLTLNDQSMSIHSESIKLRILPVLDEISKIKAAFLDREKELINLENDIAGESSFCSGIVDNVVQLQESLQDSLLVATSPALWNVAIPADDYRPLGQKLHNFWYQTTKAVRVYAHSEKDGFVAGLLVLCALLVFLVRYSFSKLQINDHEEIEKKGIHTILFNHPVLAVFTLFLISYRMFFPYHPLIIGKLTVIFLLSGSQYFIPCYTNKNVRRFISVLIVLIVLNYFQVLFWYFGNLSRYFVFIEQIAGLVLVYRYIRPEFWTRIPGDFKLLRTVSILSAVIFVFYFVALVGNLFGYFDLAILMLKVGIHIPVYTIILYGIFKIWIALTGAGLLIGKATKQNYLTHYWEKIEKRVLQIVAGFLILFWATLVLYLFEVSTPTYMIVKEFLLKERSVGTLELTFGAILSSAIVLLITFFITGLIRFVIDDEFIKRSNFPRGVINAISVTIRYFIVIVGLTFALSAAGIELGKFSLLAGALGVGIGFGLQNVVNNFISGLILVYERPLQVGDTIEIESLMGQVKKIGLRSSHVQTYDGAEVVVPNGNLISNQLINWTLSDNRRRIEVKIGAAYGSDPNVVVQVLEEVANENLDILKDPAPLALFENFGDSSLNFRLLFWVPFEIGIQTKSDVSIAIFNKFKANNIEIPFPQIDLHVKSKPEDV